MKENSVPDGNPAYKLAIPSSWTIRIQMPLNETADDEGDEDCARFIRMATVLKGCTKTHPMTPPKPAVAKLTNMDGFFGDGGVFFVGSIPCISLRKNKVGEGNERARPQSGLFS